MGDGGLLLSPAGSVSRRRGTAPIGRMSSVWMTGARRRVLSVCLEDLTDANQAHLLRKDSAQSEDKIQCKQRAAC